MILTSAERVLLHLHAQLGAKEAGRERTQAGISEGAHVLRSHVPRTLKSLIAEGLAETGQARLLGRTRKTIVYALTPAGVARAREILASADARPVEVDGRSTTLGEARRSLGLTAVEALAAVDGRGRLAGHVPPSENRDLLQRDEELAFLRRWRTGAARVAAVYGSKGMGKTALGRAFARTVDHVAWIDLRPEDTLESFAARVAEATHAEVDDPTDPESVARALAAAYDGGTQLVVVDGYGEAPEGVVDALRSFLRLAPATPNPKLLLLAQETTPAYCRFYGEPERRGGLVVERHLRGLDLNGCRQMLANPRIPEDALRRIYLLTKGCPLYLQYIREGDEYGLRQSSRFTKAETRLLLYSGGATR
ncbi:MAG TPA: ATP-binding protein [Thermoplasmata archaeon]|nr:ATP-binding protein [Thermoplasmata archaeon]